MKITFAGKKYRDCREFQEYVEKNEKRMTEEARKEAYRILASDFIARYCIQQAILSSMTTENTGEQMQLISVVAQALVDAQIVPETEIEDIIKEVAEDMQKIERQTIEELKKIEDVEDRKTE